MLIRLPRAILPTRALSSARRPYCCLDFYGAGLQLVSSARCRTTSLIGSRVRDTRTAEPPLWKHHPIWRAYLDDSGNREHSPVLMLSLPNIRFEHTDGATRQELDAQQCLRTARPGACREHESPFLGVSHPSHGRCDCATVRQGRHISRAGRSGLCDNVRCYAGMSLPSAGRNVPFKGLQIANVIVLLPTIRSASTTGAVPTRCAQRSLPPSSGRPTRPVAFLWSPRCRAGSAAAWRSASSKQG